MLPLTLLAIFKSALCPMSALTLDFIFVLTAKIKGVLPYYIKY